MMRQGFVSSVFLELLAREFLLPQTFTTIIYLFGRDTVLISSPWLKAEGMS